MFNNLARFIKAITALLKELRQWRYDAIPPIVNLLKQCASRLKQLVQWSVTTFKQAMTPPKAILPPISARKRTEAYCALIFVPPLVSMLFLNGVALLTLAGLTSDVAPIARIGAFAYALVCGCIAIIIKNQAERAWLNRHDN